MRNIVYLDIETIPNHMPSLNDPVFRIGIDESNLSPEAISVLTAKNWEAMAKKRALSNIDCRMISLSYAINDSPVVNIFEADDERMLLMKLVDSELMDILTNRRELWTKEFPMLCAYNALSFDLPVIATKLFKYNFNEFVRAIPYFASPDYHTRVFDPMKVFPYTYNEHYMTQSRMAKYLGIDDDSEMDGSMVLSYHTNLKYDKIIEYNNSDVELLRKICKRIAI